VDKRRVHLSSLVLTGQTTREEALRDVTGLAYRSEAELESDRRYFLKKMGWQAEDLERYLARPARSHQEFATERPLWEFLVRLYRRYVNPLAVRW
jgi:hypothetical protein